MAAFRGLSMISKLKPVVHRPQKYLPSTTFKRWFGQPVAMTHPHLLQEGEVTPGITQTEYKERRTKLMEKVAKSAHAHATDHQIVIIPSATKLFMAHDVPYPFRQNTDFFYLSGFLEPDAVLVLEAVSDKLPNHRSTLFVPRKDARKELWDGPRSGIEGTVMLTGIDSARNSEELHDYLAMWQQRHPSATMWYDYHKPAHPSFHSKLFKTFTQEGVFNAVESPKLMLQQLRLFKSPAEIELMMKSNKIASEAFRETMKFSHAGVNESELYAKVDFECRIRGAEQLAYPPVVAGGNRANTIHYINNNRVIEDGEMVLMDAGCDTHGYCSDITRSWPVAGKFTDPQRSLYEAVLEVQQHCVKMCANKDVTLEIIYQEMLTLISIQLQRLGIVKKGRQPIELWRLAREVCPHHIGHFLGLDVHDTDGVSRSVPLQPGMVVTIEPGMYLPSSAVHIPSEFRGVGIRIEDDVLITEDGYINLTRHCPKHPHEIEAVCVGEVWEGAGEEEAL